MFSRAQIYIRRSLNPKEREAKLVTNNQKRKPTKKKLDNLPESSTHIFSWAQIHIRQSLEPKERKTKLVTRQSKKKTHKNNLPESSTRMFSQAQIYIRQSLKIQRKKNKVTNKTTKKENPQRKFTRRFYLYFPDTDSRSAKSKNQKEEEQSY
ncbi:22734_t:CDS:1 [Gigaspora margarita]|uniref:22734_t:CDS:1 n=1 Tax=Gigaspora margarita TaxID=4874 RepID=A0ABN7UT60_GIGMA|nr:22734_t:CDS:1 [Gigaspora margarita]